jgi:hypothetical protein
MLAGAVAVWAGLARAEPVAPVHATELALLREIPMFAPLAPEVAERVAAAMTPLRLPAGSAIVRRATRATASMSWPPARSRSAATAAPWPPSAPGAQDQDRP